MKEKFTPGPWRRCHCGKCGHVNDGHGFIAIANGQWNCPPEADMYPTDEACFANANLIAVAPEMYYKIKEQLDFFDNMISTFDRLGGAYNKSFDELKMRADDIRKLLVKARGEDGERDGSTGSSS